MWNIKTLITVAAKLCWNKVMKVTYFVKKSYGLGRMKN